MGASTGFSPGISGPVTSVNGENGVVTLDPADIGAQPSDADLTAIAALTTTAFGRSFLDRADAAAGRTLLGLGTAATHATGDYDAAGTASAGDSAHAAASPAHAGSAVSVTTSGLVVITTTNVQAALAELDAATALRARRSCTFLPSTAYKAGELVVYQETLYTALVDFTSAGSFSAGDWQIVSPGTEIGYSANATATQLALATTAAPGAGTSLLCSVVVPQTPRPVWLQAEATAKCTTAPAASGTGLVNLFVYDDQGTPVVADGAGSIAFESGSGTAGVINIRLTARIPPNTASRTYTLYANRSGDSTFRAQIQNGLGSVVYRSYLTAIYR